MKSISILLPTYNCRCTALVSELHRQCEAIRGLDYEIIVADDGSTESSTVEENKAIEALANVAYIVRKENAGRSRIRNFLARQARYDWLLFIDGDLELDNPGYIRRFLESKGDLVIGGITIGGHHPENLRWLNEKAHEPQTKAAWRRNHPVELHTNFLVRRPALQAHPFDERFKRYGYEDVMLGQTLVKAGLQVEHIDNPVLFAHYEDNARFLQKTVESLHTLHDFRQQLYECNRLLPLADRLSRLGLMPLLRFSYKLLKLPVEKQLRSNKPSLFLFKIYKLTLYSSIK